MNATPKAKANGGMSHLTPALSINRSAEHRLGAFENLLQRAETVLGAPIARFTGSMRKIFRGNLCPFDPSAPVKRGEVETLPAFGERDVRRSRFGTGQLNSLYWRATSDRFISLVCTANI
jgi:hypothetical protein